MFKIFLISLLFTLNVLGQVSGQEKKNYLLNGDFEIGKTGWTKTGSMNLNILTGTNALDGKQSLEVSDSAFQTSTVYQNFLVNDNLANKTCSLSFIAKNTSATTTGSVTVKIRTGATVGAMSDLANASVVVPVGTSKETYTISGFICPQKGYYVGVMVTVVGGTDNFNPTVAVLDNFRVDLTNFSEVSNVTSWKNYTPTITANTGSLTNYTLSNTQFMQVGENIFLRGKLTFTGAVGTWSRPRVSLPNSYVIDNNVASIQSGVVFNDTGTNRYGSDVYLSTGTSYIEFQTYRGTNGVLIDPTQAAPFSWTSTDTIEWNVGPIKIVGLTNSATVINAECPNNGQCEDLFTADISTAGVITNQTPVNWLSSCTSFAPSVCTFATNHFSVTPKCWAAPTVSSTATFAFDHVYTGTTSVSTDRKDEVGTRRAVNYTLFCRRATTDFKGKRVMQADISNTMKAPTGMKFISTKFTCSSSSTLSVNTGEFSAVGNVSGGECSLTIASGVFSTIYGCHVDGLSTLAAVKFKLSAAPTRTSVKAICQDNSTGCAAWDGFVSCWGK